MTEQEIYDLLVQKGYQGEVFKITRKLGGLQVESTKHTPQYEFDYQEFVFVSLEGKVEKSKIHMLDPWTFTIECSNPTIIFP